MKLIKYLLLVLILVTPVNAYSLFFNLATNDVFFTNLNVLTAYYDLRNRNTFLQITSPDLDSLGTNTTIHVQIFQHDRDCDELDFFDTLTPNDTVVYDLDNIKKNDGSPVAITLNDNSYGYVVISAVTTNPINLDDSRTLLGNFRIIDDAGYEYRTNMDNSGITAFLSDSFKINFNNVDGSNQADVIGYAYRNSMTGSVANLDEGINFDIFVFDMDEEPLSCDRKTFACGGVMNYGINDDYGASRGSDLLCEGGGLSDPKGGFISLENPSSNITPPDSFSAGDDTFIGYIGINNGNGTGSMDSWFSGHPSDW